MFDIGGSELLVIGVVALIVVGPKDLPVMFRTLGRFTAKIRSLGREFQRAMDEAARESGVKEAADDLKSMTSKKNLGLDALDKAASKFEKWQPPKPSAAPKGPATQALADKQAAEAAARAAKTAAPASVIVPAVAPAATPEPEKKPRKPRTPASARKAAAAPAETAAAAPKKAAKPRKPKGDA